VGLHEAFMAIRVLVPLAKNMYFPFNQKSASSPFCMVNIKLILASLPRRQFGGSLSTTPNAFEFIFVQNA
jgi:hypothetical protein